MPTNFADTILNISLTGALVRIDFGTIVPVTNAAGAQEVRATQTQQLVMPLDGFVQSFGIQEQVIRKLLADGLVKANPAETDPQAVVVSNRPVPPTPSNAAKGDVPGTARQSSRSSKKPVKTPEKDGEGQ